MSMRKDKKPSTVQREETDTKVIEAMEATPGGLSFAQLSESTGYPMSTVEKSVDRLRRHGFVRKLDGRRRVGRFGNLACVYELGDEAEQEIHRKPVVITAFRHPQDIAFFGAPKSAADQREAS